MRRLVPTLALALLLPAAAARADAEADLFDLLTAWESADICGFPLPDDKAEQLDATISAYRDELGKTEDEIAGMREQAAWQVLRQRAAMCAPDGSWRAHYDQIVAAVAGG